MSEVVIGDEMFFGLVLALAGFLLSMFLTPFYTYFAYKYKFWKKQKQATLTGESLPVMSKLHAHKFKRAFPTMAGKTHPATRIFQAIRIVVNDELGEIEKTLPLLPKLLRPNGRAAIITFHSLEDRLVKDYFKEASSFGEESELSIINKSPIVAENLELVINPRARSAKLRGAKRN